MAEPFASVSEITRAVSTEIIIAAGLPRTGWHQSALRPLVWLPAYRFSRLAAGFDRLWAQQGLTAAARWLLLHLVDGVVGIGAQTLPRNGPLVVVTNHPGSYDGLAIITLLNRDDLKIIVSDVPFMRTLRASAAHMIFVSHDPYHRMAALREGVRHLESGGSLLVFASAQVDPDPALLPGAHAALERWSGSVPLLLRRVPEAQLVVTIVSGVLAPACFYHPLARLRKEQRLRQFSAEFLQVGQQVVFGRRFCLTPIVRFAPPVTGEQLGTGTASDLQPAIIARARALLSDVPAAP